MSDLLSRPIDQQGEGVHLFVGAVRRWVRAAVNGRCVCHVIGAAFKAAGLEKGAAPFHAAMQTLCNNARQRCGSAPRIVRGSALTRCGWWKRYGRQARNGRQSCAASPVSLYSPI